MKKLSNLRVIAPWKQARPLPLDVPEQKPDLNALSVDPDGVLEGVRLGFATTSTLLAPVANVELNANLDAEHAVGYFIFYVEIAMNVLELPVPIEGDFMKEIAK